MNYRFFRIILPFFATLNVQSQILSTKIFLPDWGIDSLQSIRVGQISTIHRASRDELKVYALFDRGYLASLPLRNPTPPLQDGNCLIVSTFDGESVNSLGGVWGVYQRSPSSASVEYPQSSDGRQVFRFMYDRQADGFCGMWIQLFRLIPGEEEHAYFDARPFGYLTFWLRGKKGNEELLLKAADARWDRKQDAVPVGKVSNYLPGSRVETSWQLAVIPLAGFPRQLDLGKLANLVLEAASGTGQVELKSLAFCRDPSPLPSLPDPLRKAERASFQKALWVWNTSIILTDAREENQLTTFLRREGFSEVFLALPYDANRADAQQRIFIDSERIRRLVRTLRRQGLEVHALMGDKDFLFPKKRDFVRNSVNEVIRYNSSSGPEERFGGIHFDVEPYLLPGFSSPRQEWFIQNFLQFLSETADSARAASLRLGADIPTWFDAPNDLTRELPRVSFHSSIKTVYEHIIDLTDQVVLMDYRTLVEGENGILAHARGELAYASAHGKQVLVGLETEPLPDETLMTFSGRPFVGLSSMRGDVGIISLAPYKDSILVSIFSFSRRDEFQKELLEWKIDPERVLSWSVDREYQVQGRALSFAGQGVQKLHSAIKESEAELASYPAFAGFAIHHYGSYEKMLRMVK